MAFLSAIIVFSFFTDIQAKANELYIGTTSVDITPNFAVTLEGQLYTRVARSAATPIYANIVAIETRSGGQSLDQTIFVSCDLVAVPYDLIAAVRIEVGKQLPGFDTKKIILSAIHTHTAPTFTDDFYELPKGVSPPSEFRKLFARIVSAGVIKAWKERDKGSMSWALTSAVVAQNRRAVYADSTAIMYGKTNRDDFQNFEGYSDHNINTLFFWDAKGKLAATSIDVACPGQEVEHDSTINADYWHEVRLGLKKRFGNELVVLGWIGAGGDQSPHLMYMQKADERMRKLTGETRKEAIARRIVNAVVEGYEAVKDDKYTDIVLAHKIETLALPMRVITEKEYIGIKKIRDDIAAKIKQNPALLGHDGPTMKWNTRALNRYEKQQAEGIKKFDAEIHVLRIGDIAVATNEFELFTDYGLRIQARSKALQTFIIQLAGPGTYLPTAKAVFGGSYSAVAQSSVVGPEGGQVLVDRTVQLINQLWDEKSK
ncbi:MAG: hypothetical protein EOP51_22600 [Sphingobacteriales bacterium]|nr:MAG: hypothetical protein EOP51_22600 [Sphingobacteriales bacterium]